MTISLKIKCQCGKSAEYRVEKRTNGEYDLRFVCDRHMREHRNKADVAIFQLPAAFTRTGEEA